MTRRLPVTMYGEPSNVQVVDDVRSPDTLVGPAANARSASWMVRPAISKPIVIVVTRLR
jgi:hypothetical protein